MTERRRHRSGGLTIVPGTHLPTIRPHASSTADQERHGTRDIGALSDNIDRDSSSNPTTDTSPSVSDLMSDLAIMDSSDLFPEYLSPPQPISVSVESDSLPLHLTWRMMTRMDSIDTPTDPTTSDPTTSDPTTSDPTTSDLTTSDPSSLGIVDNSRLLITRGSCSKHHVHCSIWSYLIYDTIRQYDIKICNYTDKNDFFPGQLAFCKKAVEG